MRYDSAAAFDRAIVDHMRQLSKSTRVDTSHLRLFIAFDRVIARLNELDEDAFVVTGGVALEYRIGHHARSTRDLDLAMHAFPAARDALRNACSVNLGDFFSLDIIKEPSAEKPIIEGVPSFRWTLGVNLGSKRFSSLTLDVGIEETSFRAPRTIEGPDLLGFAGLRPTTARVIPVEYHLAEKLHAYSRTYSSNRESTRVKDLVDIVLLAEHHEIESTLLTGAIHDVFATRGTHEAPTVLSRPPSGWKDLYAKLAGTVGLDLEIDYGIDLARSLFAPALRYDTASRIWDPLERLWGNDLAHARAASLADDDRLQL
jgi:hypothetical protein